MATKSIYKDITIKSKPLARNFISALENAKNKKSKQVTLRKKYTKLDKSRIKDMFGE